jgi:hypothetical protein
MIKRSGTSLLRRPCTAFFLLILTLSPAAAQDNRESDNPPLDAQNRDVKFGLQASIFNNVRSLIVTYEDRDGRPD